MQIRFSELRGKEAFNGGGEPLGQIINAVVEPKTEVAFLITMRPAGRNVGSSALPIEKLKLVDGNEVIFSVNGVPSSDFPAECDSFLSDRNNPGSMNTQIYSMNRKRVLGAIFDYVLNVDEGKRAALLVEEITMGAKRRFFVPCNKIIRSEERASGVKKILADPNDLQQIM